MSTYLPTSPFLMSSSITNGSNFLNLPTLTLGILLCETQQYRVVTFMPSILASSVIPINRLPFIVCTPPFGVGNINFFAFKRYEIAVRSFKSWYFWVRMFLHFSLSFTGQNMQTSSLNLPFKNNLSHISLFATAITVPLFLFLTHNAHKSFRNAPYLKAAP